MRPAILLDKNKWWVRTTARGLGIAPGPVLVNQYRPEFFGRYYSPILRRYLEKSQQWTRGEMELFAAYVSHLNRCKY